MRTRVSFMDAKNLLEASGLRTNATVDNASLSVALGSITVV